VLLATSYLLILTDLSADLFRLPSLTVLALQYCFYETPQLLYFVLPVSTLVASLITIGVLTHTSELVVMKACGISLYRVAAPLFVLSAFTSIALLSLQEGILPESNRRAEQVRAVIRGRPDRVFRELSRAWVMGRDGKIYHFSKLNHADGTLTGLSVFELFVSRWQLQRRIFAAHASSSGASEPAWSAERGHIWNLSETGRPSFGGAFSRAVLRLEPLEYFRKEAPDTERMGYLALSRYVDDLRASGSNVTPYVVALRRKLSFPFITVIMVLLAVPFGVTTGRRGALYGIGIAVALSFGYWTAMSVFGALGASGAMAPMLAAWAPNLLFGAGAGYLVLTTRT
jgi:LPS export ABC transporter permease LptG